jgi:DNA-binding Xre family transcriptional regulator
MHNIKYLTKHCTTSRDGKIALSNTLVETAVRKYNCPIIVTCSDFPNEECVLTVSDLTAAVPKTGPHPDQYKPGYTYDLFYYSWQGTPKGAAEKETQESEEIEEIDAIASTSTISRNSKGTYTIKTPVVVTTYEETEVTLVGYIGAVIRAKRLELNLNMNQLAILTNGKCSQATISRLEMGDANTTLSILEIICDALQLHISEIFPAK